MSKETFNSKELFTTTAIIGGIFLLSQFAFSKKTRKEIIKRDGYACVLCGSTDGCNCAHIDHSRDNPRYDDPSDGRVLCDEHHYLDHYNRHGSPNLGLNEAQNRWSLASIWARLSENKKKRLPPPDSV